MIRERSVISCVISREVEEIEDIMKTAGTDTDETDQASTQFADPDQPVFWVAWPLFTSTGDHLLIVDAPNQKISMPIWEGWKWLLFVYLLLRSLISSMVL